LADQLIRTFEPKSDNPVEIFEEFKKIAPKETRPEQFKIYNERAVRRNIVLLIVFSVNLRFEVYF
jgi:hypothetical protein